VKGAGGLLGLGLAADENRAFFEPLDFAGILTIFKSGELQNTHWTLKRSEPSCQKHARRMFATVVIGCQVGNSSGRHGWKVAIR
jgi:hypothetical protein